MENKRQLSKDEIKILIESELYRLIEASIESEYDIDRLDNLIYKEGGRKRATDRIKELLKQWEKEYDFPQSEIRKILILSFQSIDPACKDEGNEIIDILSEIETEEQVEKNIEDGNIEKNERDI